MHMTTEIIKIIEGGLEKNRDKVQSYASLLAEKLMNDGEKKFAERIISLLEKRKAHPIYMDEFLSKPVDQDSRLDMVDVTINDNVTAESLILNEMTRMKVDNYILSLKNRNKFLSHGIELPESLLLYGPPGCGKTSIAHYISQQTSMPLVTAKLDGIISSLLGSTAKNIRKIFEYAKERPCILFLDEFDAIAKARNDEQEVGELKRVVNSLLQNIDDFNKNNILIAATNHEKLLDTAVWRRFANVIEISKPKENDVSRLISLFLDTMQNDFVNDEKRLGILSQAMIGLSPSDIKTVCYKAIKSAIIAEKEILTYASMLFEVYSYQGLNEEDIPLASFLSQYGATQQDISNLLGISIRQVRNLMKKDGDKH
ncbi:ATPase [Paenibacillus baekrokdamisoli]|uniref:ATPase n=1 Tax=Paenibacillus baekrokdamisoli TaxID=1712516 RepID=A0A3G9JHN0_9BACL|nr:ATP-binding protein [Paenibacillus baekrokdamisoli]MBB3068410.1 SpoVK/Ycf46/Vps4 family AAA+-type ATPase [Paenibacillus baekrokdamisoli]BBH22544.1 ATPase [Paenibacillus baekrokdamisoli]